MATYSKNEVLDFFQDFSKYSDLSNISYLQRVNDERSRALRQIKMKEVSIKEKSEKKFLEINVNNHLTSYIEKKVSPIVKQKNGDQLEDTNKLYVGFAYLKVYFESKDSFAYFPLLMIDITDQKEKIFKESKEKGLSKIEIDFEKEVIANEEVISFFFNLHFEENGRKYSEYVATNINDFIPEIYKNNVASMLEYTYDFFRKSAEEDKNFEILLPEPTGDNSSVFMLFSSKSNFKSRKEFEQMKEENLPLVEEYLEFTQEKNAFPSLDDSIWYGSLTKDYPLGHGQAIVLQESQADSTIVPVVGGPGTGKTTLFLSIISNLVTKRALSNIYEDKDYNNLILVTSTSNKAVENVYKSLKKGFEHGFCYVGGNSENRAASAEEVLEFIKIIESSEPSIDKLKKYEDSVKRIKSFIDKRKIEFLELKDNKKYLEGITSFKDLANKEEELFNSTSLLNEKIIKKGLKNVKNILSQINHFLKSNVKNVQECLNYFEELDLESKLDLIKKSNSKINFFKKLVKAKPDLAKYGLENLNISSFEDIDILIDLIEEITIREKEFKEIEKHFFEFEQLKFLSMLSLKYNDNKKTFNQMLKYDTYGEYFRLNLYSLNYKLYLSSYNYLYQKMLFEKDKVLLSLGYLVSENQYQYLVDNYGMKQKDIEKFLRYLSLAYPVSTSTLAAIGSMFPGIYPNRNNTYQTILADESGMINVNDIVSALRRAERAIIVGDPKQLEPIVGMEEVFLEHLKSKYDSEFWNQYSPSIVSAFHRAAGTIEGGFRATGRGIMLDEHRRCQPQIANLFIDIAEYDGLIVKTPKPNSKGFKGIKEEGLMFFDTKNQDLKGFSKTNFNEIEAINILIQRLENAGYNPRYDIGIITPYKAQELALINRFGKKLNHSKEEAKIGTVHKFQGVEYKVIIFSTVISRDTDSLSFINNSPSMINVAVSRAKEAFFTVGDYKKLTEDPSEENFAGRMAKYIKKHGKYIDMK